MERINGMFIASRNTSWKGLLFTAISAGLFIWLGSAGYWIVIGGIVAIFVIILIIALATDSSSKNKK